MKSKIFFFSTIILLSGLSVLAQPHNSNTPAALVKSGDEQVEKGQYYVALEQYEKAYKAFGDRAEYRRLVEVKLNALGVNPRPDVDMTAMEGKK